MLIDDFDGTPLAASSTTTTFALNGAHYEIDLAPENLAKLEEALAPFIQAGRRVSGSGGRAAASGKRRPASRSDLGEIRAWAQQHGYKVGDRGRIPSDVLEAYANR